MNHRERIIDIEQGGFVLLLLALTVGLTMIVWPFVPPLLWAVMAAIIFRPLYDWMLLRMPRYPNRAAAAALIVILFAVLLPALWVGSVVVREAAQIVIAFREGRIDIVGWFRDIVAALPESMRNQLESSGWTNLSEIQTRLQELVAESAGLIARQAVAIGGGALGWFLALGVGLYVMYFLLRDGRELGQNILRALPIDTDIAERLGDRFLNIVRATIKGTIVVGIVQGILGGLTFWIAGLPSVVLFAVMMGIFSLLPAIGPAIVWGPAAIWLLATGSIWEGLVVLGSGIFVIGMADNILRPILVGRDTGIPDWVVLLTTLGGLAMFGLSGVVIGPLVAGLFIASWSVLREYRELSDPSVHSVPVDAKDI